MLLLTCRPLQVHAHPRIQGQNRDSVYSPVPPTVADQIVLWEEETRRLSRRPAVLLRHFPDPDMFQLVVAESKQQGVYIWHVPDTMLLIITEAGKKGIKLFIREQREAREARAPATLMVLDEDEFDPFEDFDI